MASLNPTTTTTTTNTNVGWNSPLSKQVRILVGVCVLLVMLLSVWVSTQEEIQEIQEEIEEIEQRFSSDLGPEIPYEYILRFAPEMRFHPEEAYFPVSIQSFLAHAEIRDGETDDVLVKHPSIEQMLQYGLEGLFLTHFNRSTTLLLSLLKSK